MKVRYYRIRKGRGFWEPGAWAVAHDFPGSVPCGPDGPAAWAEAEKWNAKLDAVRLGAAPRPAARYQPGTLGHFWTMFRETDAWALLKPRTRDDYEARAWPIIEAWRPSPGEPRLADTLINRITPKLSERLHAQLHPVHNPASDLSWNEAHRVLKCWRALLTALVDYKIHQPPSAKGRVTNPAPKGRSVVWLHHEVERLAFFAAWRGFLGLSIAIRLAWDGMLAPVDVRSLKLAGWSNGPEGAEISTQRAKTSKRVRHAITPETAALVELYIAHLEDEGLRLLPDSTICRRPDGRAYLDKDALGDDFRLVRSMAFPGDERQFLDIRRSAATEARMGGADKDDIGKALANTLDESEALSDTYILAASRRVLEARKLGRDRMAARFGRQSA